MILCFVLQGFDNHVKKDHNMWDYVYYSLYLDSINTSNHTALQKHVYNYVVCKRRDSWLHRWRHNMHASKLRNKDAMLSERKIWEEKVKEKKVKFFPRQEACCLEDEDDPVGQKLEFMHAEMTRLCCKKSC